MMDLKVQIWMDAWMLLTSLFYLVQCSEGTHKKIPYDVVLPPEGQERSLPPVIMLHGLMDWRKTWLKLAPEVANKTGRKVYAYDAINHGQNEWTDVLDLHALTSELEEFMRQHNISKATLLGHSLGGKTAMHFALKKPEKVEKIIIEDISPRKPTAKVFNFLRLTSLMAKIGIKEIVIEPDLVAAKKSLIRFAEKYLTKEQLDTLDPSFLMEWMPITKRGDEFGFLGNLELIVEIGGSKTPDELEPTLHGTFRGDALFLCGSKSVFEACTDELIGKHFPRAMLVQFQGANHALHFEVYREFERQVSGFINKN